MDFESNSEARDELYRAILKENQEYSGTFSAENLLETPFKEVQNFGQDQIIKLSVSKNLQMKLSATKSPFRNNETEDLLNNENVPLLSTSKKIGKYSTDKLNEVQMYSIETKKNDLIDRLFSSITKDSIISKPYPETDNGQSNEKEFQPEPVARDLNEEIEGVATHKKQLPIIIEEDQLPITHFSPTFTEDQLTKMIKFSSIKKNNDEDLLEEVPSRLSSILETNIQSPKRGKNHITIDLSTPDVPVPTTDSKPPSAKPEKVIDLTLLKQMVPLDIADGHVQFMISDGDDLPKILSTLEPLGEQVLITEVHGNQPVNLFLKNKEKEIHKKKKSRVSSGSKRQSSYKKKKRELAEAQKVLAKEPEDPLLSYLSKPEIINVEDEVELTTSSKAGKLSPMSFMFEKSLITSEFLESTLISSIRALSESIERTKQKFEKLKFDRFDYDNFCTSISPIKDKESPSKKLQAIFSSSNSDDSKNISLDKSMVIESSTPSSSNCSKSSINKYASELLQALLNKQKLPMQEFTLEEIKATLVKEFASQDFDLNMISCIQAILSKKSCIYRAQTSSSKKLIYQVPALLSQGMVLYIHTSIPMMANHIQNLMPSLSGACLNSLLNREKSNSVLELVKLNQVKILYITAERFLTEDLTGLPEISFVCLDEANYLPSVSSNHKSLYTNVYRHIKTALKNVPILSVIAPTTFETVDSLRNMMSIESSMIFPKEFICNFNYDITISCDTDKMKALITFLKRNKAQDDNLIIYTESKNAQELVASGLLTNGYKSIIYHQAKTETQKLEILSNFSRTVGSILVSLSNCEIGIDKSFVKGVVHYSMPKSLEIYVHEISYLSDNSYCHLFLNDEDYFRARQTQNSNFIEFYQISKLVKRIIEQKFGPKENILPKKLNPQDSGSQLLLKLLKSSENSILEEDSAAREKIQNLKVNELSAALDLHKDCLNNIFEKISEKNNWFDYMGLYSISYSIKFLNAAVFSNKSEYSTLIKLIQNKSKKNINFYEVSILDLANEMKCTLNDIIKSFKQ